MSSQLQHSDSDGPPIADDLTAVPPVITFTLETVMALVRRACYAASARYTSESRSYGFIALLLALLNAVAIASDAVFECVPQAVLGTHADQSHIPDFVNYLVSFSNTIPRVGNIFNSWEVKRPPIGDVGKWFRDTVLTSLNQLRNQAVASFTQRKSVNHFRSVLSCGMFFALLEWRRPSVSFLPTAFPWVKEQERLLSDELEKSRKNLELLDSRYVSAKALIKDKYSDVEAAKVKRAAAKRTFKEAKAALASALAVCDKILTSFYYPRVIYIGEAMFTQGPLDARDDKAIYSSLSGFTPQFLHALRLFYTSPDGSDSVEFKASFFDPPDPNDEAAILPTMNMDMARKVIVDAQRDEFMSACDALVDCGVPDGPPSSEEASAGDRSYETITDIPAADSQDVPRRSSRLIKLEAARDKVALEAESSEAKARKTSEPKKAKKAGRKQKSGAGTKA